MKTISLSMLVLLMAAGCAKELQPAERISIFKAGEKRTLSFRSEMQTAISGKSDSSIVTVSSDGKTISREVIEEKTDNGGSCTWFTATLLLDITKVNSDNLLKITMTVQKFSNGSISGEEAIGSSESYDAENPAASKSEYADIVKDTRFIATMNTQNQITSTEVFGKYWEQKKKEYARNGLSKEQIEWGLKVETPGVFAALDDVAAYLPPKDVATGQMWLVIRKQVYSHQAYAFYMFTNGCAYSEEESVCTLKSLEQNGSDTIAVISIQGRRFPQKPESELGPRVRYLKITGTLRFNMTAGTVEKLYIEEKPRWINLQDEEFGLKLVTTITLK